MSTPSIASPSDSAAHVVGVPRIVRLPSSRFTLGKSGRRNMEAEPFDPTADGWLLESGWQVVGYCHPAPFMDWKGGEKCERFYVGLMLQSPRGRDIWWHWSLSRGERALTDWRANEWPTARKANVPDQEREHKTL